MKDKKFVHPLDQATKAIQEARKLTKKTYSFELMQTLTQQTRDEFIPALKTALAWAKDIEKATKALDTKKRRAQLQRRRNGRK